jgi:hypothetical protein
VQDPKSTARVIVGVVASVASVLAAGCAPAPRALRPAQVEAPAISCEKAIDADFEGEGEERFWRYLDWMVRAHGAQAGLMPHHVSLAVVRGATKPGPGGVTAGEISCDGRRYRITLYRDALSGRLLQVAYRTLAHEFFHVVQVRRDGLGCEARPGERTLYEDEAAAFAEGVVPACRVRADAAPRPPPARTVASPAGARAHDRCEVAGSGDFVGPASVEWQRFIDELVRSRGEDFGLVRGNVAVAISDSPPKAGMRGVIAADLGCGGASPKQYRITLYRQALEGRRLSVAYHTLVRQFHHIVQMQRDRLSCEGGDAQSAARYEREAVAVADWLVPACN